jgi:hypothetical protein
MPFWYRSSIKLRIESRSLMFRSVYTTPRSLMTGIDRSTRRFARGISRVTTRSHGSEFSRYSPSAASRSLRSGPSRNDSPPFLELGGLPRNGRAIRASFRLADEVPRGARAGIGVDPVDHIPSRPSRSRDSTRPPPRRGGIESSRTRISRRPAYTVAASSSAMRLTVPRSRSPCRHPGRHKGRSLRTPRSLRSSRRGESSVLSFGPVGGRGRW